MKKGKARKYLKLATDKVKLKKRAIQKFRVLPLADFKTAASANKLGEVKLISKIATSETGAQKNQDMLSD